MQKYVGGSGTAIAWSKVESVRADESGKVAGR